MEGKYNIKGTPPPLAVYHDFRGPSSGGICYGKYLCLQKNYRDLPNTILSHSNILGMHNLLGTLIGYHTNFISLPKEPARGGGVVNIVMVIQKEFQLRLEEAWAKALEMHDEALGKLIQLQDSLLGFGE
ncbi:hypothetical protein TWF694_008215 [Orbilia ellipsospora]|uniref:Uncharacterized protein n=1 Tax=Orbilia ellipsospora TaxID=2528407 RepID=A0AAV9XFH3_9PEZI